MLKISGNGNSDIGRQDRLELAVRLQLKWRAERTASLSRKLADMLIKNAENIDHLGAVAAVAPGLDDFMEIRRLCSEIKGLKIMIHAMRT